MFMRLIEWFLRLIGMGNVVRLNRDVQRIHNSVAQGNYQGSMAQSAALNQALQPNTQGLPGANGQPAPMFHIQTQQAQQDMAAAAMQNAMAQNHAKMQASVAANPQLVAPIEGVTIEQYAQICAGAAANQAPGAFEQLLAQHGMDRAKYDRVAAGWNGRMRDDSTFSLSQIYGKAFGGAGTGQFGGAGAAGAASLHATGASGQGANVAGGEPVSWEKYNEIGGAQRAWAQSGKDVNAMLKQQFNVSALDWSNMSQYWMARMMTDGQKMMEMNSLQERWAAHYAAPKQDQDLSF
jgi:hypothetical protein